MAINGFFNYILEVILLWEGPTEEIIKMNKSTKYHSVLQVLLIASDLCNK